MIVGGAAQSGQRTTMEKHRRVDMGQDKKYVVTLIGVAGQLYDIPIGLSAEDCRIQIADDGTLVVQDDVSNSVILCAASGKWHSVHRVHANGVK